MNRGKHYVKKIAVWALTAVLFGGNVIPALARSGQEQRILSEDEWEDVAGFPDLDQATGSNIRQATASNIKKDIFSDMPEIGTADFTNWFFGHTDEDELWNWVLILLEEKSGGEYDAFNPWYVVNEERVIAAYHGFLGIAVMASSTGDLWTGWFGDTGFPGSGTKSEPYQIGSISQLMGLSEMVAAGISFEGQYLELVNDIDLGNLISGGGNWNPIGWYQNKNQLEGEVDHPFKGHFDGCGNTVSGLNIVNPSLALKNIGLFGCVEDGSIKNLTVEADYVYGTDKVGILAGSISGETVVYNVTVTGYLAATADAGGIAGVIEGNSKKVTIENCQADGIVIYSEESTAYTGGIAGSVEHAYLIDNLVITYDGDNNKIYGKGYVGGIAGRMNKTDIYNAYVSGTIGGNSSKAVGGIVGRYESGNLVLARFDGDIARTNNGTASHEGTFVGTRENNHNFTYGTGSNNHIAYLFTTDGAKAKMVFGSNIDGDNTFTSAAHIGYWTDNGKKYTLVAGKTETGSGDRYFYEELESGVKYIVTQKLGKEFTSSGYYRGLSFQLDHFAPGYQGEPVRGYLVSVPRIDALNANGTYDTDVATLTVLPEGNNSFYRAIDKDNPAAVAYGATVSMTTAPKNSAGHRYQMIYDESEPGKMKPPTYTDELQNIIPAAYQAGGTYTFRMPACDTEIKVEYQKVTTQLTMTPAETTMAVIHTRSGDRKNPSVTTEVKDEAGILIARYIDGVPDASVEVQPIAIHAEHNQTGETVDKTVKWTVDDTDLITNHSARDYTLADALVIPNLNSGFIQEILNRELKAQADAGYKNTISGIQYHKDAVITAASNPATSVDHKTVYGNTKVTVSFQIIDLTTVRVEGLVLNKSNVTYTITRKLTGDRLNPKETITSTMPTILTATLNPNQPFFRNVSWSDNESGKIITLTPSGDYTQDCTVGVRFDAAGKTNPVWIQNMINADNAIRTADPYSRISGSAAYTEKVKAVSEDQTHGHVNAECDVTIIFETIDETVIHPAGVTLDKHALVFDLVLRKTGRRSSPTLTWAGQEAQPLRATVNPDLADNDKYQPYNREITWTSDHAALSVTAGNITPILDSEWIKTVISKYPYNDTVEIPVTVQTVDNGKTAICMVTISVSVIDNTYSSSGGSSSGGGGGSSKGTTTSGTKTASNAPSGSVTGEWIQTADGKWTFVSGGRTYANEWAYIHNPYATGDQPKANWFRFSETGHMVTGWYTDSDGQIYYLNPVSDNMQGAIFTGWNWISERSYFFRTVPYDAHSTGALLKDALTPGGYQVNTYGEWVVDGVIQEQ